MMGEPCIFIPLGGDDGGGDLVIYRAAPFAPTCTDSEWIVPGTSEHDPLYREKEKVIEQSEWPPGTLRQTVQRPDGTDYQRVVESR
jgi:hypothetical protein